MDGVTFLDTAVILDGRRVYTDLYTKPMDTHQYLSPASCHPRHCTSSIPYSQSLRIRRICSREEDYRKRTGELKSHLLARGYGEMTVDLQIEKATRVPRQTALQSRPKRAALDRVPPVTTFHPGFSSLASVARRHMPILHSSQRLQQAFPKPPIIAFRRPKNLRDLLVRSNLETPTPPPDAGSAPCNSKRCKCCPEMVMANGFLSYRTGRRYNIRTHMTCKSSNIVYLITCRKCSVQYVGETENPLHIRMNGHRSDIRTGKLEKPVAAHFSQPGHSAGDLQVCGIEKIHRDSATWRKQRESYWIFELRTLIPNGLNLND